jgi:hypothetical protein
MVDPFAVEVSNDRERAIRLGFAKEAVVAAGEKRARDWVRCGTQDSSAMNFLPCTRYAFSVENLKRAIAQREETLVTNPVNGGGASAKRQSSAR